MSASPPDKAPATPARKGRSGPYQAALRKYRVTPKWVRIVIGVGTIGIIVAAGVADGLTRSSGAPVDQVTDSGRAHPFQLPSVADPNQTVSLSSFSGHPIVLNFWGSWCAPCRQEMPLLAAAARREGGKIDFLGVDLEDTRGGAQTMIKRYSVGYPSVFDPNDTLAPPYQVVGSPTTVFIDSKGDVVGRVQGALTASRLDWWLTHLS